jgi:RHS repeat-associated protein
VLNYPFLTSKERDVETGLDYFEARYYSSPQGRFTSPDEFDGGPDELYVLGNRDETKQALPYAQITKPQSLNKYQYCYNNPLNYVDPDGHDALYVVDKDKGTTTIVIPVHFTGANATPGLIAEVIKRGSELDTGDSGVKIQIVSTDKPIQGVLNTMDLSQGKDFKKYWAGEGVNRVGGNRGHIDTNGVGQGGAIVHESLHFAGLKDRYQETTKDPKKGRGKATPDKGYDKTNIMAASGGTTLKPAQIKEARQNSSTKKCSVENGSMKCK